jgi:hypothetical protein
MNGVSYIHTTDGEITLLATTKINANAVMVFNFLYSFINIFKSYFGEFTETLIKNNFVLIYEVLDYGYHQVTDPEMLKKYITQGGIKNDQESSNS